MGEVGNIPLKLIANETALPTELYPRASERNYRETPFAQQLKSSAAVWVRRGCSQAGGCGKI